MSRRTVPPTESAAVPKAPPAPFATASNPTPAEPDRSRPGRPAPQTLTVRFRRVRRGNTVTFTSQPPPKPRVPVRRPARVAVMLALAHKIQDAIDRGVVEDRAEVARMLGVTRARVTHLLDLTLLPVEVQERLLVAEAVDGVEPATERGFRRTAGGPECPARLDVDSSQLGRTSGASGRLVLTIGPAWCPSSQTRRRCRQGTSVRAAPLLCLRQGGRRQS